MGTDSTRRWAGAPGRRAETRNSRDERLFLPVDVRGTGPDREAITALAADRGFRYVPFGFTPSADDLGEIAALVDSGTLRVRVDRTLRLAEAARAHELGESGQVRGKLVLLTG